MENYTYTEQKKAHLALCVFDRKGDYPGEKMCAGPLCMEWVHETDETGNPTGRGRCGIVQQQIFITMPGVSTPYDTPSRHWWEANRVEG